MKRKLFPILKFFGLRRLRFEEGRWNERKQAFEMRYVGEVYVWFWQREWRKHETRHLFEFRHQ